MQPLLVCLENFAGSVLLDLSDSKIRPNYSPHAICIIFNRAEENYLDENVSYKAGEGESR